MWCLVALAWATIVQSRLSNLNGTNGFKLDGENNNDDSGFSVSAAGDINGDGHADLLIGAYCYPSYFKGRSYVVFGGSGVGNSGLIALSSLTALMALNSMAKIIVITVPFPSVPQATLMTMGMRIC